MQYLSKCSTESLWSDMMITFHVRCSQGKMYSGHGRLCVCLSVPRRISTLLHGPTCDLGEWRGCTIGWVCNRCTGFVAITE